MKFSRLRLYTYHLSTMELKSSRLACVTQGELVLEVEEGNKAVTIHLTSVVLTPA